MVEELQKLRNSAYIADAKHKKRIFRLEQIENYNCLLFENSE